jgi:L-lactate dehydrogenase complex protein LldG
MMPNQTARERILARLHASGTEWTVVPQASPPPEPSLDPDARLERLSSLMTAIRTEVHTVAADDWTAALMDLARERRWKTLLYGPGGPLGAAVESAWRTEAADLPVLTAYGEPVEAFKETLFQIDAGITSVRGAVADTGAIVLWPTPQEPRLLSLVPPVHVAVLDADTVYNSLSEMMAVENWADGMPTNALLISGPSKTADIEFTLVFGVHGPKELILLIRK